MNRDVHVAADIDSHHVCPICRGVILLGLPEEWCETPMVLCPECPVVFRSPMPRLAADVLHHYRSGAYWNHQSRLSRVVEALLLSWRLDEASVRLREIESALGQTLGVGQRVLDVGCGPGEVIYLARLLRSCDVVGLEPSSREALLTRSRYGLNVVNGDAAALPFCERFDVILALHVIEHVAEPVRVVRALLEALTESGHLIVECPNLVLPSGGMPIRRFFERAHLWTFSLQSLVAVIWQAGGRVVFQRDDGFIRLVAIRDGDLRQITDIQEFKAVDTAVPAFPRTQRLDVWAILERYQASYRWSAARMQWWWTRILFTSHLFFVAWKWFSQAVLGVPVAGSST